MDAVIWHFEAQGVIFPENLGEMFMVVNQRRPVPLSAVGDEDTSLKLEEKAFAPS